MLGVVVFKYEPVSVQRAAAENKRKRELMDKHNQILDVTYGNFSCRLEGFEDSVETMKTVVSFFHDLAGHERFMDVPPLAPDMDELAQLTEEQSGQPVEVEGDGNSVSLLAGQAVEDDDLVDDIATLEDEIEDDVADDAAEEDVAAEDDAFDVDASVADKLQRIRQVVDGSPEAEADEFAEDLGEDAAENAAANPLSQRLADLAQRDTDVADEDNIPEDAMDAVEEDDTLEDLRDVFDETADDTIEQSAEAVDDDDTVTDDADIDDAIAADDLQDAVEALDDASEDDRIEEVAAQAEEADDDIASDASDEKAPLVLTANDAAFDDADDQSVADDDTFDLQQEVAKVEAEIASRQERGVVSHGLPRSVEDAMSRIMSQTDQHLNQPESRRHRDAFAQLKAAVAATEAARQLGDNGAAKPDPDEAFKDDLGAHDAEELVKSQAIASAPLQLVPSQKVEEPVEKDATEAEAPQKSHEIKTRFIEPDIEDAPAAAEKTSADSKPLDAASERLRQISALKEADSTSETAGFAEFAAAHGATDLVDQLEAAGAYICFVEGAADFSRPQVMKVVQSASSEEITREDGLRCFGRLLRQARLIKLANGRFQVAENTQYRPDGDQAAQG